MTTSHETSHKTIAQSRLRFSHKGQQNEFVTAAIERSGHVEILAEFLGVNPRTVRDWRREKFLMSYEAARKISEKYNLILPKDATLEDEFWYTTKAAKLGGDAVYKKYGYVGGEPIIRKQKWREWWEREGQLKDLAIFHPLSFKRPEKSILLAEFMGTMMGDGGMTKRQIHITLHHIDDLAYCKLVAKTIKKLFGIIPSIYHHPKDSVNIIVVSRSELVKYLHALGLLIGNKVKQRFDIPPWIKEKREYMIACIRGLVDTDGSVFTHHYRVNGKMYAYKKICFSSSSPPLIKTVHGFLVREGFHARITRDGKCIRIESIAGVKHYMNLIGPHNPKHLKRYQKLDIVSHAG